MASRSGGSGSRDRGRAEPMTRRIIASICPAPVPPSSTAARCSARSCSWNGPMMRSRISRLRTEVRIEASGQHPARVGDVTRRRRRIPARRSTPWRWPGPLPGGRSPATLSALAGAVSPARGERSGAASVLLRSYRSRPAGSAMRLRRPVRRGDVHRLAAEVAADTRFPHVSLHHEDMSACSGSLSVWTGPSEPPTSGGSMPMPTPWASSTGGNGSPVAVHASRICAGGRARRHATIIASSASRHRVNSDVCAAVGSTPRPRHSHVRVAAPS